MSYFNIVAQTNENTVVTEYEPVKKRSDSYQSEAALENEFIHMLEEQGYEYLSLHTEGELVINLRKQLEKLNNYSFTDREWKQFLVESIANPNEGIKEKTRKIQEDYIQVLRRDDGTSKNIILLDKKDIHHNYLQVIHQYEVSKEDGAKHDNRYDVTILINGFPLVHVELKRRGVPIREAFNQVERYQRDSFNTGYGLFEYVQIFVISNGTNSKYYSNTTRYNTGGNLASSKKEKTSNSFEFTSYWADAKNNIISDLIDFTRTFFARHTILNILTKYCVFTSEEMLLVMRPYQITATERIINRIEIATNYKKYGSAAGGGYIWHTTGSGKTLTSFKAARLATTLPYIEKVLFVVDRQDLDYQTMREYDRFEKGSANSNRSTAVLKKQLEDDNAKIIITTIQKLSTFVKKNPDHPIYQKHLVIIFDECHRSQFGEMHRAITKNFKKYHLFGFTGTPIFGVNAGAVRDPKLCTTEQAFGDQLHTYTIVNAINDRNVLPFHVDYIKTMDKDEGMKDEQVWDIDREKAYMAPERISLVTEYILDNFDKKTYRGTRTYNFNKIMNIDEIASARLGAIKEIKQKQRINGFNSIFCVNSVPMAKLYYEEFKRQMAANPTKKINIATIFSYSPNEYEPDGLLCDENIDDTSALDQTSRDFLDYAMKDYNEMFKSNYSTDGDSFQNYYKDVSLRMKNKELDLLIVVNMFLTGFDATTLNTLWVDKNLRMHGLLQAFSRTNRILNSVKAAGNVVCFRNLQTRVDDAIALFGDKDAGGIVLLHTFNDYYYGYEGSDHRYYVGYVDLISELCEKYPLSMTQIIGENNQKQFIKLFGNILRMRNILLSFDEFAGKEILSERDLQDYLGRYQDLYDDWKNKKSDEKKEDINDDIVFEIELLKHIEINIDYILLLVQKYHDSHCQDREVLVTIQKAIQASPQLRSKKELIDTFIAGINDIDDIMSEWHKFIAEAKEQQLMQIITEENLKEKETRKFLESCLLNGEVKTSGKDIDSLLPPMSWFDAKRSEKKQRVIDKFRAFFERFYGIGDAVLSMHEEPSYNYDEGHACSEFALVSEESPEYDKTKNKK